MSGRTDTPRTTPRRAIAALAAGAAAGGLLIVGPIALLGVFKGEPLQALAVLLSIAPIASAIWIFGLLWLGAPAWLLLHGLKLRRAKHAAVLGGLLAAAAMLVATKLAVEALPFVALVAAAGVGVALVVWRVAYGGGPRGTEA